MLMSRLQISVQIHIFTKQLNEWYLNRSLLQFFKYYNLYLDILYIFACYMHSVLFSILKFLIDG